MTLNRRQGAETTRSANILFTFMMAVMRIGDHHQVGQIPGEHSETLNVHEQMDYTDGDEQDFME